MHPCDKQTSRLLQYSLDYLLVDSSVIGQGTSYFHYLQTFHQFVSGQLDKPSENNRRAGATWMRESLLSRQYISHHVGQLQMQEL